MRENISAEVEDAIIAYCLGGDPLLRERARKMCPVLVAMFEFILMVVAELAMFCTP